MALLEKNLEQKNYTLFLSSNDKISGTNNNANFDINFDDFLPRNYDQYKMAFSFQSGGGQYKDITTTTAYNITSVSNNTINLTLTANGMVGIGSLVTGKPVSGISGTFNATVSGNQMTQVGATSVGNVCVGASLTGSGNQTLTFTGSISNVGPTYGILNVSVAPGSGNLLRSGFVLSGGSVSAGTTIVTQIDGTTGGVGNYQVSIGQTVASQSITGTLSWDLAGTTITALSSGAISSGSAIYTLSKDFGNSIYVQITPTAQFNLDITTTPTYITAGTTLTTSGQLGTFTISNSTSGITPTGLTGITGTATCQIFSGVKISFNTSSKSYSFDSSNKSMSNVIGYASRDIQTGTSASNSFSTWYLQYQPKTIDRPTQKLVNVQLNNVNAPYYPLVDTDVNGVIKKDCTSWNMIIEFVPIENSKKH